MEKKTALYQKHVDAGGKMVPFAGYLLPVQYPAGVMAEHKAVRTAAGLFDVSHMGEVMLRGAGALDLLQKLLTNDFEGLAVGGCRYSPMCNEAGGVLDDLIVYRTGDDAYMLVVNAVNREKDAAWIKQQAAGDSEVEDISGNVAELALQGPQSQMILSKLLDGEKNTLPEKYYTFLNDVQVAGVRCLVSRTGYTGEDGFELYCAAGDAPLLWDALIKAGEAEGLVPCGLGARDTLRLEAGMPLYGNEMSEGITPLEAGLGLFVKMDKADFVGRRALAEKSPPARRRASLRVTGRGIVREGALLFSGEKQVGVVTSGTMLPFLGWPGAMALLDEDYRAPGVQLEADVRGRRVAVEVVKGPFYKR